MQQFGGPHKATNGKFYSLIYHQESNAERLRIYEATDPTSSWSLVSGTDADLSLTTFRCIKTLMDGNELHFVGQNPTSGGAIYHGVFDVSTGTWTTSVASIGASLDSTVTVFGLDLALRSDGTVIIVYNGATDAVKGDDKQRIYYASKSVGWVFDNALVASNDDIHYGNPVCAMGSGDNCHVIWQFNSDTFDPPINWTTVNNQECVESRTIDSNDNLSTTTSATGTQSTRDVINGLTNAVFYADGATDRIAAFGTFDTGPTDTASIVQRATTDANDDIQAPTGTKFNDSSNEPYVGKWTSVTYQDCAVSYGALNGTDLYYVYAGGGANGVDQDLYWTKSTDDGATWDTATELQNGIDGQSVCCNVYTRGTATVLGIIYGTGTAFTSGRAEAWYYTEYVIAGGAKTASGNPSITGPTASGAAAKNKLTASGTANVTAPTASGAAAIVSNIRTASGTASVTGPTASGVVRMVNKVSAAITAVAASAVGAVALAALTASGTVDAAEATSTGTVKTVIEASGNVTAPSATASGSVSLGAKTASGSADTPTSTATGTAALAALTASGNPDLQEATASGTAAVGKLVASGTPDATGPTASGTIGRLSVATGSPDVSGPTSSGVATQPNPIAYGTPDVTGPTASGSVGRLAAASGTPDVSSPTSAGSVALGAVVASGSADVSGPTSSGTVGRLTAASGTPDVTEATASGAAPLAGSNNAFGTPDVTGPTASGSVTKSALAASGSADVASPTASGAVAKNAVIASGSPDVSVPTASGAAGLAAGAKVASGAPDVTSATASGAAATGNKAAAGSADVALPTATGSATTVPEKVASGSPDVTGPSASGAAGRLAGASGSPSVTTPTASGAAAVGPLEAQGVTLTPSPTASGIAANISATTASGSADVSGPSASGAATKAPLAASGSADISVPTAFGTAGFLGVNVAFGSPQASEPTASGAVSKTVLTASGSAQAPSPTASGTATGPTPEAAGGGGGWDPHRRPVPSKYTRKPLQGLSLRTQPIQDEDIEEQLEETVDEVISEVESVEKQVEDTKIPGQDIARIAAKRVLARQEIVRNTRKAQRVSRKLAEAQLEARINELVRQRRQFFESENEDLEAILFILSELV
jgi:hypothetical protein